MTTLVEGGLAAWLKSTSLRSIATDNPAAARWGARGKTSTALSPIAFKADADAVAADQLAFFGGASIVVDRHLVAGARRDLIGRPTRLTGNQLGYDAIGQHVFVIGVDEQPDGTTYLTVLRRLA